MIKRRLSLLLTCALFLGLLPLTALAADGTIGAGGFYALTDYGSGSTITVNTTAAVTITGDAGTAYTNVRIICAAGVQLTLDGVNIDNSETYDACALSFAGAGNTLTLTGENTLTSGDNQPGVKAESGTSLAIGGSGTLTATGGDRGAGIGGSDGDGSGNIMISGCTVTANGGYDGAGVGGGQSGDGGSITISGGTVTANGGAGAGIGGGKLGDGGTVIISGGTVNAVSSIGAGIGGGEGCDGGSVTITGGNVTANTIYSGAGIGGGLNGEGGTVSIFGGTVTATGGGNNGAGIGSGGGDFLLNSNSGTVIISGGIVTANGAENGAGIGGGGAPMLSINGGTVTISGGIVTANGGECGAGIGGGLNGEGGNVTITGGIVTTTGGYNGTGIGGGRGGSCGTVTISGGSVTATGGYNAAGIGGGDSGAGGTVYISGGSVKANGGDGAQSIGHGGSYVTNGGTLKNKPEAEGGDDVYLTTVTLSGAVQTAVVSLITDAGYSYGINDMKTDADGMLYLWLPVDATVTQVRTADNTYNNVSGTFVPRPIWVYQPPVYSASVENGGSLPVTVHTGTGNPAVDIGAQLGGSVAGGGSETIVMPAVQGATSYTLRISAENLSVQGGTGSLTFTTDTGSMTLPSDMLAGIAGADGKKAEITIGAGDKSGLSDELIASIGGRPLVQLTLSLDGRQADWSNPTAPVIVSIPYMPTSEELENTESIVIWYIDGSGHVIPVPNGRYDAETGTVTFTTTHFSLYAIGYNSVHFTDVAAGAWYARAVSFIAARGIAGSTGDGSFSLDAPVTRGEFIFFLMRAYSICPDPDPSDHFADAGDTHYAGYLSTAKLLGISSGIGNNLFAPDREITRQEMFTLSYNALKAIDRPIAEDTVLEAMPEKVPDDFTDADDIADWAKDALTLLVETGVVIGNGGKLCPTGTATRAEMAQTLYNLLGRSSIILHSARCPFPVNLENDSCMKQEPVIDKTHR